jgi:hypothetical protein
MGCYLYDPAAERPRPTPLFDVLITVSYQADGAPGPFTLGLAA